MLHHAGVGVLGKAVGRLDGWLPATSHFTYGELEENAEDLTKLRGWSDKVAARDRLDALGARQRKGP
jgi:hypothetical protein